MPPVGRFFSIVVFALAPWVGAVLGGWTEFAIVLACVWVPVLFAWWVVPPRNDLDWAPDQDRLAQIEFDGDHVTIRNLRRWVPAGSVPEGGATVADETRKTLEFAGSSVGEAGESIPEGGETVADETGRSAAEDGEITWYDRTFDLSEVRTVDYIVVPFGRVEALAHSFVTFGFSDGLHLPISVEVRRERPEVYNPVAGIYRQYEIMYVMGDERDLIGRRANVKHYPVYVYPVRATRRQVRNMLESMLHRAQKLGDHPEFYNTLINNCSTNILRHLNEIEGGRFPLGYRVIAPGLSAFWAYEHGLIDTDLPFQKAKELYRINERAAYGAGEVAWSKQIRRHTDLRD